MRKKNIIYIYADDLGRGMLSCYGQKLFKTPNIDKLCEEGMRFTNFCATAFCAPARASLICGMHDAHAGRWSFSPGAYYKKVCTGEVTYDELQEVLQNDGIESASNGEYIATIAKKAGYVTAEIGKLEWGFSTTAKQMENHGWDYHYGYYDHIQCHGFYPPFLMENGKMIDIEGNTDPHCGRPSYEQITKRNGEVENPKDMSFRKQYSQDLFDGKVIGFIRENKDRPFFLFHPSQLPHGLIFYPEIYPEIQKLDCLTDLEKEYASMVLRLDETVGKIVNEVEELGLREDTIIMFASDNGHVIDYQQIGRTQIDTKLDGSSVNGKDDPFRTETCGDIFNGNDSMAGLKFSNWNGGCVIPFIASCPSMIEKNSVCDTLMSNYDTLATIADIVGVEAPKNTDGISYLPILKGEKDTKIHDYVIYGGSAPALVSKDGFKLRVYFSDEIMSEVSYADLTNDKRVDFQLYDLKNDYSEKQNIADKYPEKVKELKLILLRECDGSFYNGTSDAHRMQPILPAVSWEEVTQNKI